MTDPSATDQTDRVPLKRKIAFLTQRGHWPEIEAIAAKHGWHSPELATFVDGHLPTCVCPACGACFSLTTRRVRYCSETCRKLAANARDRERRHGSHASAGGLPAHRQVALAERQEFSVRLERHVPDRQDHRFYQLKVVQTLFGKTALIRTWGRTDADRTQTLTLELDSRDSALAEMDRIVTACLKRGYSLLPSEESRQPLRFLRPGRNGSAPRPSPSGIGPGAVADQDAETAPITPMVSAEAHA